MINREELRVDLRIAMYDDSELSEESKRLVEQGLKESAEGKAKPLSEYVAEERLREILKDNFGYCPPRTMYHISTEIMEEAIAAILKEFQLRENNVNVGPHTAGILTGEDQR